MLRNASSLTIPREAERNVRKSRTLFERSTPPQVVGHSSCPRQVQTTARTPYLLDATSIFPAVSPQSFEEPSTFDYRKINRDFKDVNGRPFDFTCHGHPARTPPPTRPRIIGVPFGAPSSGNLDEGPTAFLNGLSTQITLITLFSAKDIWPLYRYLYFN